MQANGIALNTYQQKGSGLTLVLNCGMEEALTIKCPITVTRDEITVAVFDGYEAVVVEKSGGYVKASYMRKLDEATEAAINGLDATTAALAEADTAINDQISALTSAFAKEA